MKSKLKTFTVWIIMGIIFVVLLSSIMDNSNTKLTYSELIAKMELGEVKKIELEDLSIFTRTFVNRKTL